MNVPSNQKTLGVRRKLQVQRKESGTKPVDTQSNPQQSTATKCVTTQPNTESKGKKVDAFPSTQQSSAPVKPKGLLAGNSLTHDDRFSTQATGAQQSKGKTVVRKYEEVPLCNTQ